MYKRQVWPALTWLRMFHGHHSELVRHLFLVDRLLDGVVLEVDASTTGGGAACWCGDRARSQHSPPDLFVSNVCVKSIPPTTENWLRKLYKYSKKNYKSTEDKHETNHINNK